MAKTKAPKADRLPLGKFLAWKSSDITSAGVFLIISTYLSMFCTDFLGMTPLVVGNIILVSNVIDFFTDLIVDFVATGRTVVCLLVFFLGVFFI